MGGGQEVESDVGVRHEKIPFGEWEFWVAGGQARAEVIFPVLDSSFSGVAAVAVRRNALEIDVVFFEA